MAMHELMETTIPSLYTKALYDDKSYDLADNLTDQIATVYFNGVSYALKDAKSKERPASFIFEGMNGDMYAGAVVRYIPNEEEDMPGHWSYIWTFDRSDIPDDGLIIGIDNVNCHSYFRTQASEYFFGFVSDASIADMGNYFFKELSHWLQENALVDEEVGVELPNVFKARAIIEDNEVIKSIELIGETKAIIKDDQAIEV